MSIQCIDAEYKGEERYTKISLSYSNQEQYEQINAALKQAHEGHTLEQNIYTTDIAGGRKVLVIEYHDDYDREAGEIFEKLMKILKIDHCG
jgi:hypothetical protein